MGNQIRAAGAVIQRRLLLGLVHIIGPSGVALGCFRVTGIALFVCEDKVEEVNQVIECWWRPVTVRGMRLLGD